MVEHAAVNRTVAGSSPAPGAIFMFYTESDLKLGVDIAIEADVVNLAYECYEKYFSRPPKIEKNKIDEAMKCDFIKYFATPFHTEKADMIAYRPFNLNCTNWNKPSKTSLEITSFYVESETKKQYEKRKDIYGAINHQNNKSFIPLVKRFGEYLLNGSTASIIFYKQGAHVAPHAHDWTNGALHVILEDIIDGSLDVTIGKETKSLSKKGDWLGFDTKCIHTATMSGKYCKSLGFMLHNYATLRNQ